MDSSQGAPVKGSQTVLSNQNDQPQGYAAFDWESILHGNAGGLGDYKELALLPDKIARYLYKFHADSYALHGLPPLPVD